MNVGDQSGIQLFTTLHLVKQVSESIAIFLHKQIKTFKYVYKQQHNWQ